MSDPRYLVVGGGLAGLTATLADSATRSFEWVLVTADGRQVESSELGPSALSQIIPPGTTATQFVRFGQVPLGGTLRFVAFADDFETEIRFNVPVPA
jgi:hypothetical protein